LGAAAADVGDGFPDVGYTQVIQAISGKDEIADRQIGCRQIDDAEVPAGSGILAVVLLNKGFHDIAAAVGNG